MSWLKPTRRRAAGLALVIVLGLCGYWVWDSWLKWQVSWAFSPGGSLRDGGIAFARGYNINEDLTLSLDCEQQVKPALPCVKVWKQHRLPSLPGFDRQLVPLLIEYDSSGQVVAAVATSPGWRSSERTVDWAAIRLPDRRGIFLDFRRGFCSDIHHWYSFVGFVVEAPLAHSWSDYFFHEQGGLKVSWDFDDDGSVRSSWIGTRSTSFHGPRGNPKSGWVVSEGVHEYDSRGKLVLPEGPDTVAEIQERWPNLPETNPPTEETYELYQNVLQLSEFNLIARRWLEARKNPENRWPPQRN